MSITNELREWAHGFNGPWKANERAINAIADRIDAAVASEYVRLPKDADGEPIHIGDVMDTEHFGTVEVEGFVHHSVAFYNYSEQPAYLCTTPVDLCHHYHEPTVEDVLRECCGKYHSLFVDDMNDAINRVERDYIAPSEVIAEYAEKLREVVEHERD